MVLTLTPMTTALASPFSYLRDTLASLMEEHADGSAAPSSAFQTLIQDVNELLKYHGVPPLPYIQRVGEDFDAALLDFFHHMNYTANPFNEDIRLQSHLQEQNVQLELAACYDMFYRYFTA